MLFAVLAAGRPGIVMKQENRSATTRSAPPTGKVTAVALRQSPRAQLMVTASGSGTIVVESAAQRVTRSVTPGDHVEFIDLPQMSSSVTVGMEGSKQFWTLKRRQGWPIIEVRAELSAAESRVVEVYARRRPSGDGSIRVAIVNSLEAAANNPAVIVPTRSSTPPQTALSVSDHPVTRSVRWDQLKEMQITPAAPKGWQSVLRSGDQPLVALREEPARQVWLGFQSADFSTRADFVIFWTNLLDWAGQGGEAFEAIPPEPVAIEPPRDPSRRSLSGECLLIALGCAVLSAALWPKVSA